MQYFSRMSPKSVIMIIYNTDPACIQSNLVKISKWCNRNSLTVNCKKSQWMRTRIVDKMAVDQVFKLGNDQLEHVMEYKYSGLNIDTYLNFQSYRDMIMNRIILKICYLRKIRSLLTQKAALLIYKCTTLPILEYTDFIYDFNIKYVNKKLQTIQNTGLYIVFNQHQLPYDMKESTETIHRNAKLFRLAHRRRLHMLSFVYNYVE